MRRIDLNVNGNATAANERYQGALESRAWLHTNMPPFPNGLRRTFLALLVCASAGAASVPTEYDIKAVFLYHFTQFVAWPEAAFPDPNAPFVIGLVGTNPFGPALQNIVGGEAVGRHHLVVQGVSDVSAESRCQILYFSEDGESLLDMRRLRTAPVLTVGESDSFYKNGGMIQFFFDRRRIRLKVNLEEARAHSLEISAKLLRVADVTEWDPIRIGVYAAVATTALESKGRLAEYRPLDLLVVRPWSPEFRMLPVQEILAHH
jgi:hypothetical protein